MSTDGNQGPLIVDILPNAQPAGGWNPAPGPETNGLSFAPDVQPDSVIEEACRVLLRCLPPTADDDSLTGLVIGYVQSGKTMSFTTLAALARDNGFRLIIVITGTSNPLFNQSRQRLIRDLRIENRPGYNPWRHISRPNVGDDSHIAIQDTLAEWNDPSVPPNERRTILVTVNKNHTRLQDLINVLARIIH